MNDIQRKLGILDDKNDQDILDEHVSRVWSDRTPQRTPGNVSPRNLLHRRRPQETTALGAGVPGKIWLMFIMIVAIINEPYLRYSTADENVKDVTRIQHAKV